MASRKVPDNWHVICTIVPTYGIPERVDSIPARIANFNMGIVAAGSTRSSSLYRQPQDTILIIELPRPIRALDKRPPLIFCESDKRRRLRIAIHSQLTQGEVGVVLAKCRSRSCNSAGFHHGTAATVFEKATNSTHDTESALGADKIGLSASGGAYDDASNCQAAGEDLEKFEWSVGSLGCVATIFIGTAEHMFADPDAGHSTGTCPLDRVPDCKGVRTGVAVVVEEAQGRVVAGSVLLKQAVDTAPIAAAVMCARVVAGTVAGGSGVTEGSAAAVGRWGLSGGRIGARQTSRNPLRQRG